MTFTAKEKAIGRYVDGCFFLFVYVLTAGLLWFVVDLFGKVNPIGLVLIAFIAMYVSVLSIRGEPIEVIESFRSHKN